jgi:hypothetical protein
MLRWEATVDDEILLSSLPNLVILGNIFSKKNTMKSQPLMTCRQVVTNPPKKKHVDVN